MKYIYLLIFLIATSFNFFSQSDSIPRVKVPIIVSNDVGSLTVLEVGLDSLASDDFDYIFGEANLPPLPPPTAWDTRLLLPEGGFSGVKSSFKDYRNAPSFPFTGSKEHRIQYQVGTGTTVTISWNFPIQINGQLQDIITGTLINVPMNDSGSYTVAQPNIFNKLKLTVNYQGIIPVELVSFAALVNGNNVNLNWQTATELNNSGFEIEKRKTINKKSEDWKSIGFVAGNGTTTESQIYTFVDQNISSGNYQYRLKQIDFDGSFSYSNILEVNLTAPIDFVLSQNYPNPFNPSTSISFSLPQASYVKLSVYNQLGEKVDEIVNENLSAGIYNYTWNASKLASGVYFYELTTNNFQSVKKMTLMK
jgi:hypothetical protein